MTQFKPKNHTLTREISIHNNEAKTRENSIPHGRNHNTIGDKRNQYPKLPQPQN